jgi:hypothetical protein
MLSNRPIRSYNLYNYYVSGHYQSSCFYLKHTALRRLGSLSVFSWNLVSWAKSVELVPIHGLFPLPIVFLPIGPN